MASINKHISRYEATAVYTHPDAKVDIVLVHGLNGGPDKTWTAKNGVYWPTDLLPASLKDALGNIIVYGYNADVSSSRHGSASHNFIHEHAQSLVATLTLYRKSEGTSRNPIIWVVHSLGGILLKRALLYSNDVRAANHEDSRSIFVSTYGIIFLGTPHTGSTMATWGRMLQAMSDAVVPRKLLETEPILLKTLKRDNETLQNINNHFLDIYQRFRIHMAHENHKTDIKGTKIIVVDQDSASPQLPGVTYYGIEASHSGMCKFDSASAPGYRNVSTAIRDWVHDAPEVVAVRWQIEDEELRTRAGAEINERMRPFVNSPTAPPVYESDKQSEPPTSPTDDQPHPPRTDTEPRTTSQEPLFIHPDQFRPNSYFIGRETELKELHKLLMDKRRRADGTSAVLIQSLPGGGKTHLARQYVFKHRKDYPGGVYWIRAKSLQEMEDGFWQIAKTEALKKLVGEVRKKDLQDPSNMVYLVRSWFESFDNWLLVLDGVYFDTLAVEDFIPNRPNTALIFTSTESAITGSHVFDSPRILRLPLLAAREAQELLLEEMEKKKPWTQDDLSRALEAVELMGRLPLMIHAAAQHLKATKEPLSKYLRSFKNRPKVGGLLAYQAVREHLQHRGETEALNLLYLLAFFGQRIPVEMLGLGLKALDKRTPVKKVNASKKRSLNNTFAVLIAFALIERNDLDDNPSASSKSSWRSLDMSTDTLDVIRIRSIVQAFFVDTLASEKQAAFWLERAVAVFCLSYDEADKRISQDTKAGLPDDYRLYAVHGQRLMEHVQYLERKHREWITPKQHLQDRLQHIEAEVDKLTRRISIEIVDGGNVVQSTSVFERTNSLSETESTQTPESGSSLKDSVRIVEGDQAYVESPVSDEPKVPPPNPYHYHVPYTNEVKILAPSSSQELFSDDKTLTPTTPRSEMTGSLQIYDPDNDGWAAVRDHHRAVKKQEERRYHDRAGAWRETKLKVNDPRVSSPHITISRELASGYISSINPQRGGRSTSRTRLTAGSEAELKLNEIKRISPPPSRGGKPLMDRARSSGTRSGSWPWPILGRPGYAESLAENAVDDDNVVLPTFSNGFTKGTTSPSSYTAATLQRLKENRPPSRSEAGDRERINAALPRQTYEEANKGYAKASPSSNFGPRNSNFSPGQQYAPFDTGTLPIVVSGTSSLTQRPVAARRGETLPYPIPSRINNGVYDEDSLKEPIPAGRLQSPPTSAQTSSAGLWQSRLRPDGYTSQPMSRNPSSDTPPATSESSSSPRAGSGSKPGSPSGLGRPISLRPRRPSIVETEPSPRLESFDAGPTSYEAWNLKHGRYTRATSLFMDTNVPATRRQYSPGAKPRPIALGSPEIGSGSGSAKGSSKSSPVGSLEGGENMSRSGSGGIRLPDGKIIKFGDVPVDIEEGGQRTKEDRERIKRREGQSGSTSRSASAGREAYAKSKRRD